MSKTVEEPVQTETPAPVGRAAFAAARAQVAEQSKDQDTTDTAEASVDDTATKTPVQETAKPADEPKDTGEVTDDSQLLSAEELAALPAAQRKQAEKWQAKLTRKAQDLSAQEKKFQQWTPLIDGFTTDPDATLQELAKQRGFTIAKPSQETAVKTDIADKLNTAIEALPAELRPLFQPFAEALGKEILTTFEGRLKPLAETQMQMISEASAAETQGEIKAFEADHSDFKKHEPAMLQWMQKFTPAPGTSTRDYMEAAYQAVTANLGKVEQIKETVKKINRSVESVEPNTPGVSDVRVEQTRPANWAQMTDKERMRAAYNAASQGIVWK